MRLTAQDIKAINKINNPYVLRKLIATITLFQAELKQATLQEECKEFKERIEEYQELFNVRYNEIKKCG